MANIALNEDVQLNLNMEAMTENTEGHCDEWNVRHKQLLENDQYLNGEQETIKEPEFTVADKRENISSKEKLPKILGKIARFFADLKTVAFSGSYSDLSDKPTAATQTKEGFMSASDKKKLDGVGTGANKISVVNNNTTTQAGFALDARQANPNIEGTLAANILQLNNDSNPTAIGFEKISTLAIYESVEIIRIGKHLAWYNLWLSYAGSDENHLEESILRLHDINSIHYITGGSCSIYGQQSCDNTGIIYSHINDNSVELRLRVKGNLTGGFGVYATGIFVIS